MRRFLPFALVLITVLAFAQPTDRDRYILLRKQAHEAIVGKNWGTAKTLLRELEAFQGTRARYNLACVEALSGNPDEAFRLLNAIAASQVYFDVPKDDDLASLRHDARYEPLLAAFRKNLEPVTNATVAYTIGDSELITEDLTYDPQNASFLFTSILRKTVTRIDTGRNKFSLFADLGNNPGWPLLAIAADPKRRVLWVTAAAMPDFVASPPDDYGKTVLLKLDLRSGNILDRFAPSDSEQRAMGDMTLARDGGVIVTDGRGGAVYRLRAGSSKLERIDHGEFISPQTPALSPDEKHVFVPDYVRGIGRIELATGAILWLPHPEDVDLAGIDGLYARGQELIAIQNGVTPARVVRLRLNPALDRVERLEVLESNSPALGDPTHGVFVGNEFFFIANSGWSQLDDNGRLLAGHKLTEPTIRKLTVK